MGNEDVTISLGADDQKINTRLDAVEARLKRLADEGGRSAKTLSQSWEAASQTIGKSLLAVSASISGALAVTTKEAGSFDQQMRNVNSIAKLSEQGLKQLSAQVVNLSNSMRTGKDAIEMASSLKEIYGAGLDGAKAMAVLKSATVAADAGMTDMKTSVSVLTTAMMSYRLPAEKAAYVTDILFKTVDRGKIEFSDLASSIGPVLSTGAAFGVKIEEIGAAMAELSKVMQPGQAATGLESLIVQLAAPTEEARKKLDALGIAYGRSAIEARGFMTVLADVERAAAQDADLRKLLHSQESLRVALALSKEKAQGYSEALIAMGEATGSAAAAQDQVMQGAEKRWEEFIKTAKNAALQFGQEILPLAAKGIVAATDIVREFAALTPENRKFYAEAALLTAGITAATGAFILLAPAIAAIPEALSVATLAMSGTWTAMAAGALPLAALAGGLMVLRTAWEEDWGEIREITNGAIRDIRITIGELRTEFGEMQKSVMQWTEDVKHALIGFSEAFPSLFTAKVEFPDGDFAESIRKTRSDISGLKNRTGLSVSLPSSGASFQDAISGGNISNLEDVVARAVESGMVKGFEVQPTLDPKIQKILDDLKATMDKDKLPPLPEKKKGHQPTEEDIARNKIVVAAESLVGRSLSEVDRFAGLAGDVAVKNADTSNKCADTVRTIGQMAGIKWGMANASTAVDSGPLKRLGLGVGADHADSLPGRMIHASEVKRGDLVMFKDTDPRYAGTGVVTHIGVVIDPVKGLMVDASSSTGQVKKRAISTFRPDQLFGFVRPDALSALSKSGKGGEIANFEELAQHYKKNREEFQAFIEQDYQKQIRELTDRMEKAIKGAQTPAEVAQIKDVYAQKLAEIEAGRPTFENQFANLGDNDPALQREMVTEAIAASQREYDFRRNMIASMSALTRQQHDEKRRLDMENSAARIAELSNELRSELLTTEQSRALTLEKAQLESSLAAERMAQSDEHARRLMQDLQFQQQMGTLDLAQKAMFLQQELQLFAGSYETKRQLELDYHGTVIAYQQEQMAGAQAVFDAFSSSMTNMFTGAINGQQNWSQSFQNIWKSVANAIIQEIIKMIVKALALKAIMNSIFGFFGGIFGLGGGVVGGAGELGSYTTFHSGGVVGEDGIKSYHSGGVIGKLTEGFRPDEVLGKLQIGEVVWSRAHVAQARAAVNGSSSRAPVIMSPNFDMSGMTVDSPDRAKWVVDEVISRMGIEFQRYQQGAR